MESNIDTRTSLPSYRKIYLAGGCFWGTEHLMKQIRGVKETAVGYANSNKPDPTYREVCSGDTDAAETVEVSYDPTETDLRLLLQLYFKSIDPTSLNRQGNDRGTQYRTGIYYISPEDKPIIEQECAKIAVDYDREIVVEICPLDNFYRAEPFHQDYLEKNPGGYCHIDPELFAFAREANPPHRMKAEEQTSYLPLRKERK